MIYRFNVQLCITTIIVKLKYFYLVLMMFIIRVH